MPVEQAPPGAVPFVKISRHSPLQVAVFQTAIGMTAKLFAPCPTTAELVVAVRKKFEATEDEVIQAIEELRGDATLFMLPDGRLRYDSYDSH